MSLYFYSFELIIRDAAAMCGEDEECARCDWINQQLYDLSREENR